MKAFDPITSLGAIFYNVFNSYLQVNCLIYETYSQSLLFIILGFSIYFFGFIVNIHSDQILINLSAKNPKIVKKTENEKNEKKSKKNLSEDSENSEDSKEIIIDGKYRIPYGGLFKYISAANYWGELVEWLGMWICLQNCASFSFFFATFGNLGTRSISTHKWYKEKFGKLYPKNRRALIPGIY
eukprot:EC822795.1.p1 GENE.EC822795.1~~EC822795.1.p1  ORF type:complete len:184 (-),score=34.36 EC822795.1:86-637(-)